MATTAPDVTPAPSQSPISLEQVMQFLMQSNNVQQLTGAAKPKNDINQATPDQVASAQAIAKGPTIPIVPAEGGAGGKATLPDVLQSLGLKIPGMEDLFGDPSKKADATRDNAKNNGKEAGGATKLAGFL